MERRVFLIVLDSLGAGALPDAARFGDEGSDTLGALVRSGLLCCPNLQKLGLFNLGTPGACPSPAPLASYGRCAELSNGKDTTVGHWEIAGAVTSSPFPTFPNGFPEEIIRLFIAQTGRKILCNRPYSGTEVIRDFGEEHLRTGKTIVYTSADSVFQIAAHKKVLSVRELYAYCEIARKLLTGKYNVGRVIARPFDGEPGSFFRTTERKDFSRKPPHGTMLDCVKEAGLDVIAVGKIENIFAGEGITESIHTDGNPQGMAEIETLMQRDFHGLCFVNLVDFDMKYGHRNDVPGYAQALNEFDGCAGKMLSLARPEDLILITADHGCDPSTPSTDHSREYIPLLAYSRTVHPIALGIRPTFADIGATVCDWLGTPLSSSGSPLFSSVNHRQ